MFLKILEDAAIAVGVISFGIVVFGVFIVYFLSRPENYR